MTLAKRDATDILEKVVIEGDLITLSPAERVQYYARVCESLGINPLTKPFNYLRLNNRLVLYATRDATDQLRKIHGVNISKLERERIDDVYVVTAYATDKDGRTDSSIGAVTIGALKGDALANALMKAETKSKRRVTLSIVGLGWVDEVELETIPEKEKQVVDAETGEVIEPTLEDKRDAKPASIRPATGSGQAPTGQLKALADAMEEAGWDGKELTAYCQEIYRCGPRQLSPGDNRAVIQYLKTNPHKKETML